VTAASARLPATATARTGADSMHSPDVCLYSA